MDLGGGVRGLRRPHPNLMKYYAVESLLLGPFFLFWLIPRFLRFRTLRFRFDDEGVTVRWGALFRKEVSLTYGRIQDIHLASNLVERRLGLARVKVQTAAGSATAELTIEGLQEYQQVRDFLYTRMRGVRGVPSSGVSTASSPASSEVAKALLEAASELRALRNEIAGRRTERES